MFVIAETGRWDAYSVDTVEDVAEAAVAFMRTHGPFYGMEDYTEDAVWETCRTVLNEVGSLFLIHVEDELTFIAHAEL